MELNRALTKSFQDLEHANWRAVQETKKRVENCRRLREQIRDQQNRERNQEIKHIQEVQALAQDKQRFLMEKKTFEDKTQSQDLCHGREVEDLEKKHQGILQRLEQEQKRELKTGLLQQKVHV